MAANTEQLLSRIAKLKASIEERAAEKQRLLGKVEQLKVTLKENCGTDDIEKARKKLAAMKSELQSAQNDIQRRLAELEAKYAPN